MWAACTLAGSSFGSLQKKRLWNRWDTQTRAACSSTQGTCVTAKALFSCNSNVADLVSSGKYADTWSTWPFKSVHENRYLLIPFYRQPCFTTLLHTHAHSFNIEVVNFSDFIRKGNVIQTINVRNVKLQTPIQSLMKTTPVHPSAFDTAFSCPFCIRRESREVETAWAAWLRAGMVRKSPNLPGPPKEPAVNVPAAPGRESQCSFSLLNTSRLWLWTISCC